MSLLSSIDLNPIWRRWYKLANWAIAQMREILRSKTQEFPVRSPHTRERKLVRKDSYTLVWALQNRASFRHFLALFVIHLTLSTSLPAPRTKLLSATSRLYDGQLRAKAHWKPILRSVIVDAKANSASVTKNICSHDLLHLSSRSKIAFVLRSNRSVCNALSHALCLILGMLAACT